MPSYLKRHTDWLIFVAVYLAALGLLLRYALFVFEIGSDQAIEYRLYLLMIQNKGWTFITDSTINSSLTVTLFPSYIQRLTNIDTTLLFKIFPTFFYALMPAFIYLIARKCLNRRYSILTSAFVLTNFSFAYYPAIGRTGIALGFFAGMVWALTSRRYILGAVFAGLVVFSHYGTAYIALLIVAVAWIVLLAKRRFNTDFKTSSIVLAVLLLSVGIWYVAIAKVPYQYATSFAKNTVTLESISLDEPQSLPGIPDKVKEPPKVHNPQSSPVDTSGEVDQVDEVPEVKEETETSSGTTSSRQAKFFKLEHREITIQVALGKTFPYMSTPQRIEFVSSWIMVVLLSVGFFLVLRRRLFPGVHTIVACTMFCLIIATIIIPHLSVYYGMNRVCLTSLVALAPCLVIGAKKVAEKIRVNGYMLVGALILVHGLNVSGITHLLFGIVKQG